jgi:hypothetical protein
LSLSPTFGSNLKLIISCPMNFPHEKYVSKNIVAVSIHIE